MVPQGGMVLRSEVGHTQVLGSKFDNELLKQHFGSHEVDYIIMM